MSVAYAECLKNHEIGIIERALKILAEKGTAFCPSAPEILEQCEKLTPASSEGKHVFKDDHHAIAKEARRMAWRSGLLESAAQAEWTAFREWFHSLGATKMRVYIEWPKWLRRAKDGVPHEVYFYELTHPQPR